MTLRYLLDTNVISERASEQPNILVVARIQRHASQCALASPTWHELVYGCERLPEGRRRKSLELFLRDVVAARLPILDYDHSAADWHAKERARLDRAGKPTPFIDGQIAAIAYANDLVLVTRNTKDFVRFQGIDVVDWSKRASKRN